MQTARNKPHTASGTVQMLQKRGGAGDGAGGAGAGGDPQKTPLVENKNPAGDSQLAGGPNGP
eukprot:3592415-Lingulodinium_polyedra.AAC.1